MFDLERRRSEKNLFHKHLKTTVCFSVLSADNRHGMKCGCEEGSFNSQLQLFPGMCQICQLQQLCYDYQTLWRGDTAPRRAPDRAVMEVDVGSCSAALQSCFVFVFHSSQFKCSCCSLHTNHRRSAKHQHSRQNMTEYMYVSTALLTLHLRTPNYIISFQVHLVQIWN